MGFRSRMVTINVLLVFWKGHLLGVAFVILSLASSWTGVGQRRGQVRKELLARATACRRQFQLYSGTLICIAGKILGFIVHKVYSTISELNKLPKGEDLVKSIAWESDRKGSSWTWNCWAWVLSGQCELIQIARLTVEGEKEAHGERSAVLRCLEIDILRTPAIGASSVLTGIHVLSRNIPSYLSV